MTVTYFIMRVRAAHITASGELRPVQVTGWPCEQALEVYVGKTQCFARTCGLGQCVFFAADSVRAPPADKTRAALLQFGWLSPVLNKKLFPHCWAGSPSPGLSRTALAHYGGAQPTGGRTGAGTVRAGQPRTSAGAGATLSS